MASNAEAVRKYRSSEKGREANRKWNEANREVRRQYSREYYRANRERLLAAQKARYEADKPLHVARQIESRYRVDLHQMLTDQGGTCAVCSVPFGDSSPNVDHDHACCAGQGSCGECVRGLLCRGCNQGLGNFSDDPERLMAAAAYLLSRANLLIPVEG